MAQIKAFKAVHFDSDKIKLSDVVTQPYDKIDEDRYQSYLSQHKNNVAQILLPRAKGGHDYKKAHRLAQDWLKEGVLCREEQNQIYRYTQNFVLNGKKYERDSFIAITRTEPYSTGTIVPHETTLSGPKEDRLKHLRETGIQFGLIFVLYDDPQNEIQNILRSSEGPWINFKDHDFEVEHNLWQVTDANVINAIIQKMKDRKLFIADGHHRYETALKNSQDLADEKGVSPDADLPYQYCMMAFVNMRDERLVVFPTHRLVMNVTDLDMNGLIDHLRQDFQIERIEVSHERELDALIKRLRESGEDCPTLGLYSGGHEVLLLKYKNKVIPEEFFKEKHSEAWRSLDVVILHQLILDKILGIDEEALKCEANLRYARSHEDAVDRVKKGGAQLCFLMNPVSPTTVRDVSLGGDKMPQKSTDFYPKFMSGMLMYDLNSV